MKRIFDVGSKVLLSLLLLGLVAVVMTMTVGVLNGYEVYYNVGPSIQAGWYLCSSSVPSDPPVPTLVKVAPPVQARELVHQFNPHQQETPYWLKYLVTHPGQTVCLQDDEVRIDDQWVAARPLSKRYPLALNGCWTLGPDQVFVLGTHPDSFDSRYTGPWQRATLKGTCEDFWTWKTRS